LAELTNKVGEKKSDAVRENEEAAEIAAKLEEAKLVCAQLEEAKQAAELAEVTNEVAEKKSDAVRENEEAAEIAAKLEAAKLVCAQLEQAKQAAEARPQNEQEQSDTVAAVAVSARPDAAAHVAGEALVSKEPGGRQFEFRFDLTMLAVFI
jgi:hypothetical protein